MSRLLLRQRDRLQTLARRRVLTDAARPLRDLERRVDDAVRRLRHGLAMAVGRAAHRLELATRALRAESPVARAARDRRQLHHLHTRLGSEVARALARSRHRLQATVGRLDSLSPLAVLGRGYSLTRTPAGDVVRSVRQLTAGAEVRVLLHEGSLECRVAAMREHDDRPQI
jgi:exodeoxyribonuclease VII large subunit